MTCVKLMRPIGVGGVALAYCCGALWLSCKSAGGGADAEAPDTGAAEAGGKGTSGSGSGAATGSGSAGTSIRDAGHAHDDACPTLSGQLSYSFGLANPIVAASSGMFPCNSEAELAAQYYACLYIEISRPSVGEQAVFVTGVQFPKASASGVTVGISGLVDADGPFVFSNINFWLFRVSGGFRRKTSGPAASLVSSGAGPRLSEAPSAERPPAKTRNRSTRSTDEGVWNLRDPLVCFLHGNLPEAA